MHPIAKRLAVLAMVLIGLGVVVGVAVPINKRLWTPSYTVLTAGISALVLLALHLALDHRPTTPTWVTPLIDLGRTPLPCSCYCRRC